MTIDSSVVSYRQGDRTIQLGRIEDQKRLLVNPIYSGVQADQVFVSPDQILGLFFYADNRIVRTTTEFGLREMAWLEGHDSRYSNVGELVQDASQEQAAEKQFGRRINNFFETRADVNAGRLTYSDHGRSYHPTFSVSINIYVPTRKGSDYARLFQVALHVSVDDDGKLGLSVYNHASTDSRWVTEYDQRNIDSENLETALAQVCDKLPKMLSPQHTEQLKIVADRGKKIKHNGQWP